MSSKMKLGTSVFAFVMLLTATAVKAQEAPRAHNVIGTGPSQMFYVALVVAANEATPASPQSLPKGVEKAIANVRDFLPFNTYRLADAAMVRANGSGKVLLKGPNDDQYVASLYYRDPENNGSFLIDQFELTKQKMPTPNAKPLAPGVAPLPAEQPLALSFRISRGETVVVGSSSLGAGRAMIVVLTAVP